MTAWEYPSRKTCERTRGMQRSVVTDADRRMQNSRCAVCAVIKLRAGMEGLPQARRKELARSDGDWRPSVSGPWNTRCR